MKKVLKYSSLVFILAFFVACGSEDSPNENGDPEKMNDYEALLRNQVIEIIIPTYEHYSDKVDELAEASEAFISSPQEELENMRTAYQEAYLAYQAAALHNYFATSNQNLVNTTNLYPVDLNILAELIETESYNFSTTAQQRATGYPALDYMLYGPEDIPTYFSENSKRGAFLLALVRYLQSTADILVNQWTGELQNNFINNGGTGLGSSISVQLNQSLIYYEEHVRENKVGIPIGRLGPNDSPIPADPTKKEAFYQSQYEGNEQFTLQLVRAAIEEMEDIYVGYTTNGINGQGYDDLLLRIDQGAIDIDIKAQYNRIYEILDRRTTIAGDEELYNAIQEVITLYKSDLFPVLNIQDADGANDGD